MNIRNKNNKPITINIAWVMIIKNKIHNVKIQNYFKLIQIITLFYNESRSSNMSNLIHGLITGAHNEKNSNRLKIR